MSARHGSVCGYRDDRCHCDDCRKAVALEHNLYKLRVAANGGRPLSVPKTGAVRRLRALMALGWSRRELARRAGYEGDAFALVLNGNRQRLFLATHERICALYEELCMVPGPSERTRQIAREKGWLPPLAWDDIDDPAERPRKGKVRPLKTDVDDIVVERFLGGDYSLPTTRAERFEITRRWRAAGRTSTELERVSGWKPERYIDRTEDLEESA